METRKLPSEDANEKTGPFLSSCEKRNHVNVGWELLVHAMCHELVPLSRAFLLLL